MRWERDIEKLISINNDNVKLDIYTDLWIYTLVDTSYEYTRWRYHEIDITTIVITLSCLV